MKWVNFEATIVLECRLREFEIPFKGDEASYTHARRA